MALGLVAVLLLAACAATPYSWESEERYSFEKRATTISSGSFDVRASVLGDQEAKDFLGIDVYGRDVQPVWVEIRNQGDTRARISISSIDPKYFPPAEVAWFFKKQYSKEGWMDLEERLIELSLPRQVEPGATVSGLVFTNLTRGTKAFNLDVFAGVMPPEFEQFTFFVRVPGFVPDYANVRLNELVPEGDMIRVTSKDVPSALRNLDCCTRSGDGRSIGRPVNVFIVSDSLTLLRSLLRAGWNERPSTDVPDDPASLQHFFGRPADGVFRKPRTSAVDRTEIAVWKAPLEVDGLPLWAVQVRHAVGRRFELGDRLFGVRLDPDVDEGRNYLLQTFWYAQTLNQWGLSDTGRTVPEAEPETDFLGNPWFSLDGYQAVMWLSPEPVPMNETEYVEWDAIRGSLRDES